MRGRFPNKELVLRLDPFVSADPYVNLMGDGWSNLQKRQNMGSTLDRPDGFNFDIALSDPDTGQPQGQFMKRKRQGRGRPRPRLTNLRPANNRGRGRPRPFMNWPWTSQRTRLRR
jgi:hypothetical protein